jgi:Uncharacterized protein conserved in bacteria (DUF2252)
MGGVCEHLANEDGLAVTGLSGDENHAAVAVGSLGKVAGDRLQLRLTLEQRHKMMVRVRSAAVTVLTAHAEHEIPLETGTTGEVLADCHWHPTRSREPSDMLALHMQTRRSAGNRRHSLDGRESSGRTWSVVSYSGPVATAPTYSTLQPGESAERGRAARKVTPRSAHGDWAPAPDRPDPIAILVAQAASRVPELVPIRYGRMLVSPFTFYRGAAAVMAADLATTPDSGITVQACGDAHIANFGGFAAPDRRLVFGPNDFDETLPGPWEWDVKRMAASVEVAGRDIGLGRGAAADRGRLCALLPGGNAWLCRREPPRRLLRSADRQRTRCALRRPARREGPDPFRQAVRQGAAKDECSRLREANRAVGWRAALPRRPPLLVPFRDLYDSSEARVEDVYVHELIDEYAAGLETDRRHLFESYRFVDAARKVVGVGSVGTRASIFLFVGRGGKDPLVLQAKEAQASVLEPYLGSSEYSNHAERIVRGQRISHAATDIFLSWQRSEGLDGNEHDFYVRQLWDWKASIDLANVTEAGLHAYTRRAAGRWRAPTRGRAIGFRSRPTWGRARASTRRSSASRPPTPTKTGAIIGASRTPSPQPRSPPSQASEPSPVMARPTKRAGRWPGRNQ